MKAPLQDTEQIEIPDTREQSYTTRLVSEQTVWWKKILDVQAPYRWNIRRLHPGFTLDIGCGIGRNLTHLKGRGVGIDHNRHSVEIARSQGLQAFTPEAFEETPFNNADTFDSILLAHVAEHMTEPEATALLKMYVHLLRRDGKVILITPQERGYHSDRTHVEFMDFKSLRDITRSAGLVPVMEYSFPFPRILGRVFRHNEFVVVSKRA